MTSTKYEIGIGTTVTYEDMANPLRQGKITDENGGVWLVKWDDGTTTSVTKAMLASHREKQSAARDASKGRIGGWDAFATLKDDDIRMGDKVRLADGRTITVESVFSSYHDAEGEHEGPFVSDASNPSERYLASEVVAIVKRNERRCSLCGDGVTSTNPDSTYCRNCFYIGAAHEDRLTSDERDVLARIGAIEGVEDASVWHTGGGCFNLGIRLADGRLLTPSVGLPAEDGSDEVYPEPGIPNIADGERWCLVVSASEEAWDEWNEDAIRISKSRFTDEELVEAVRATVKGEEV